MGMLKKMDEGQKVRWINALRSGKYEQGTGYLKSSYGYCCWGLYAHVCKADLEAAGLVVEESDLSMAVKEMRGGAETYVARQSLGVFALQLGLDFNAIPFLEERNDGNGAVDPTSDNGEGDNTVWDFNQIADWIERNL